MPRGLSILLNELSWAYTLRRSLWFTHLLLKNLTAFWHYSAKGGFFFSWGYIMSNHLCTSLHQLSLLTWQAQHCYAWTKTANESSSFECVLDRMSYLISFHGCNLISEKLRYESATINAFLNTFPECMSIMKRTTSWPLYVTPPFVSTLKPNQCLALGGQRLGHFIIKSPVNANHTEAESCHKKPNTPCSTITLLYVSANTMNLWRREILNYTPLQENRGHCSSVSKPTGKIMMDCRFSESSQPPPLIKPVNN